MSVATVAAEVCDRLRSASRVALYLDFDGTLSPIVTRHEDAVLPDGTRKTLARLALDPRFVIAIVSGRAIPDLRRRVGIPGLIYAGNHGLEIQGCGVSYRAERAVACEQRLVSVVSQLHEALRSIPGAEAELKGLTASIHFRRVNPAQHDEVAALVRHAVAEDNPDLLLREAKMVIEIRPRVEWDKGRAVLWIRRELCLGDALEIFMGDDTTDEDAFQALPDGLTIHIGHAPTAARFSLADPEEAGVLLKCVLDAKGAQHDKGE